MSVSECSVCQEDVTTGGQTVECGRCQQWFHLVCVGLEVGKNSAKHKVLTHSNIIFLCNGCKTRTEQEWRNGPQENTEEDKEETKEEKYTQTVEDETNTSAQTDTQAQPRPAKDQPRVKRMVRRKAPIRVFGDSIVRKLPEYVKTAVDGSGITSIGGARLETIRKCVEEETPHMDDGSLLVVQGGGNGLVSTGCEETVKEVLEAVKAAETKKMSVAVVGIIRRPREGQVYEELRQRTNRKLQEELLKVKMDWLKAGKGNVSFIDLDGALTPECYACIAKASSSP